MLKTLTPRASQTPAMPDSLTIPERIADGDQTAAHDCIDADGNLIRVLAQKSTDSPEQAEAATLAIFNDIWRTVVGSAVLDADEAVLIVLLARRRLLTTLITNPTLSRQQQ